MLVNTNCTMTDIAIKYAVIILCRRLVCALTSAITRLFLIMNFSRYDYFLILKKYHIGSLINYTCNF